MGTNTYRYTDQHPLAGVSYYRIVEYDINGEITYSQIREVHAGKIFAEIFPNPFNTSLTILILSGSEEIYEAKVMDVHGRLLEHHKINSDKRTDIGENWSPGVYIIQISNQSGQVNYKIIKQ
jgi:hypothetical protein